MLIVNIVVGSKFVFVLLLSRYYCCVRFVATFVACLLRRCSDQARKQGMFLRSVGRYGTVVVWRQV